jgi:hypothetical protein
VAQAIELEVNLPGNPARQPDRQTNQIPENSPGPMSFVAFRLALPTAHNKSPQCMTLFTTSRLFNTLTSTATIEDW